MKTYNYKPEPKTKKVNLSLDDQMFFALLSEAGLPIPKKEFMFHPDRNWKFDYCYIDRKIAIEKEGGIFVQNRIKKDGTKYKSQGAHGSVSGILRDIEKYNEAVVHGYKILRIISSKLLKKETIILIQRAMGV